MGVVQLSRKKRAGRQDRKTGREVHTRRQCSHQLVKGDKGTGRAGVRKRGPLRESRANLMACWLHLTLVKADAV